MELNAGHWVMWGRPDEFNDTVVRWLEATQGLTAAA